MSELRGYGRYELPSVAELRSRYTYDPITGELRNKPGNFKMKPGFLHRRAQIRIRKFSYITTRIIWKLHSGEEPPLIVDYRDGNPLNFIWDNLRPADYATNQWNRSFREGSTNSGHRGIRVGGKNNDRYSAFIKVNGRNIPLGTYGNLDVALKARADGEIQYYGEYQSTRVHSSIGNYKNRLCPQQSKEHVA